MLHATGDLLTIDVGARETSVEPIDDVLETYVGGRGVGTRLAHERIPFDVDPFGDANSLFFTTGPLQISQMSFTGRMNLTGVSPLTDGLLSSNAGGYMSRHFADTGYAAVQITGQSDDLLAIHVTDEGVSFEPVPSLREARVDETTAYMDREHDLGADQLAIVGPAGENRVRFAAVMTSESRAFGRGGLGAVMGSKNVKAVSFDGDSRPDIEVSDVQTDVHRDAATSDSIMKEQGTASLVDLTNEMAGYPTRYFRDRSFESADRINGARIAEKKYKTGSCSLCAFACKLPTRDDERGVETEGPEFETTMSFGSNQAVDDIVDVMISNELCDQLGLDTISAGDVIAAYLAAEDEFGNAELAHELIEKIAHREDEGDLLAEGVDRIHDELGVKNWSVKGLEFPAHEGRLLHGQALGYMTANRGADHLYSTFYAYEYPLVGEDEAFDPAGLEGKPEKLVWAENKRAVEDLGVICRFSRGSMDADRFEALYEDDFEALLDVGANVIDLERHFNNERGMDRSDDDALPYDVPGIDAALSEYYDLRGWADDGTVPEEDVSYLDVSG
ncbi:aldehyde ferredoxin oxidoreductase family protein [Halanaeroarchaeum sulfurireducens]|uniref:Aldehyde:ferredoxin oxidoreductase n=1 Tax=Halanaeroarchaeum sulfurireducens TaxID=1604004 RepID=A0A0F7PC47_9EURY|nr:aldehyde ferredoxin oxidoreductase C-terminal domain-containing protein [Halanaeroarchaeum sulfurireducens]AKH98302.1 aldehyde:ferredoxin oxidoreductase [Halanaeroarchaeum sulfurireducens]